jgi:transposase
MDVIYERCCGLDIHKKTVVACLVVPGKAGKPAKTIRTFGTMTGELLALGDWLAQHGATHVAMEATGVYWKPLYNLLEDRFTLLLVNAQHIKAVPGRKTDVRDCEWIADLLRHGLLRASSVPDRPQRELRELTRYRTSLVRERVAEANRLQKTLEGANIKLGDVASDVLGRSGRQMLDALVAGETDAAALAQLARGRLRDKLPALERALAGRVDAHQRFLLGRQLAHLDHLAALIDEVSAEIRRRLDPPSPGPSAASGDPRPTEPGDMAEPIVATHPAAGTGSRPDDTIERLMTIPGIGRRTAEVLIAEIGCDMGRFSTAAHLASWAGMCPGNHQSAGRRKSGRTRKGSPWLRAALIEAAQAARRSKGTYLGAQYARLAARRGAKKAAVAVGHSILISVYHLLNRRSTYDDLGDTFFDRRDRERVERRLVDRLEALGFRVTLDTTGPAA